MINNCIYLVVVMFICLFAQYCMGKTITNFQRALYKVIVNGEDTNSTKLFLVDDKKNLYVDTATLKSWGLVVQKDQLVSFEGKNYYTLAEYKGYTYKVNFQNLTINLVFPAQYFIKNTYTAIESSLLTPQKPPFGAYINYDLYSSGPVNNGQPSVGLQNSELLTPTVFGPWGNLNAQYLISQNSGDNTTPPSGNNPLRLQSFYQLDLPDEMQTIIVGDSTTSAGSWGQSVLFGGISWETNFWTQPNYTTFPLPAAEGTATVPTSVQLLVANAVVDTQKIAPGPFTINNIPVVSGAGTLNVLTKNVFGQQIVTTIPYYASNSLLKPGLQDFSYQFGFVRENYGINSNDYGPLIGIVNDRLGVTNNLTVEGNLQGMRDQQNFGAGFAYSFSNFFMVNAALENSQNILGAGSLVNFGIERRAIGGFSFGANFYLTSANYLEIAATPQSPSPSTTAQLFLSKSLFNRYGSAISYTEVNNRGGLGNNNYLSFKVSRSFPSGISLILSGLTNITGQANRSINLTLSMSFGSDYNISMTNYYQGSSYGNPAYDQIWTNFTKNTPAGQGYGYDLQTTQYALSGQNQANYQGAYYLNADYANASIYLANQSNLTSYQANVTGAVTYMDQKLYLSPQVNGSFALAELPGLSGVNVYYNNQLVGQTNNAGNIIIPNLMPYRQNNITIDPQNFPINTEIDDSQISPVPYANEGIIVHFPIQKIQAVVFNLILPDKNNPPVGAIVRISNAKKVNYVGYNGEVYLPFIQTGQTDIAVSWSEGECNATINFKGAKDANIPISNLGTILCKPLVN